MGVKETAELRVGQEVLHVARDQSEASSVSEISKWYEHHVHTHTGRHASPLYFRPAWVTYRKGQKGKAERKQHKENKK